MIAEGKAKSPFKDSYRQDNLKMMLLDGAGAGSAINPELLNHPYTAPECYQHQSSQVSDIYSLAAVFCRMVLGNVDLRSQQRSGFKERP
ncbi:MAG: hypothetical protein R2865_12460 [Deinococcales bacterium]